MQTEDVPTEISEDGIRIDMGGFQAKDASVRIIFIKRDGAFGLSVSFFDDDENIIGVPKTREVREETKKTIYVSWSGEDNMKNRICRYAIIKSDTKGIIIRAKKDLISREKQ